MVQIDEKMGEIMDEAAKKAGILDTIAKSLREMTTQVSIYELRADSTFKVCVKDESASEGVKTVESSATAGGDHFGNGISIIKNPDKAAEA
jgi:hypothetical protein